MQLLIECMCVMLLLSLQDIRRIVRNDSRIINKLHRRVFLDKISLDDVKIYVSFYCEASNRDAFMAIKQVCTGSMWNSFSVGVLCVKTGTDFAAALSERIDCAVRGNQFSNILLCKDVSMCGK